MGLGVGGAAAPDSWEDAREFQLCALSPSVMRLSSSSGERPCSARGAAVGVPKYAKPAMAQTSTTSPSTASPGFFSSHFGSPHTDVPATPLHTHLPSVTASNLPARPCVVHARGATHHMNEMRMTQPPHMP